MDAIAELIADIRAIRPFLPAKDYGTSLAFYGAIGFHAYRLGDTMAELSLGHHAFLLQGYYVKELAENTVMHMLVGDVQKWWRHLASLDLPGRFGTSPPSEPRVEPWGLTVSYLTDPAGVLWHFAQPTEAT